MVDEDLEREALNLLLTAAALILQQTADVAIRRLPMSAVERLSTARTLTRAGEDVRRLGQACETLIHSGSAASSPAALPLSVGSSQNGE